jgi:hypothetical protein
MNLWMLPPGLTFRPCPASVAINDASPACVLAVSVGPAWNERRPTDRILGRAWRVVGNSPSVVLCHSRNAATGETIVRVAEAAGPPHIDSHPRAAKAQGGCSRPLYLRLAGRAQHFSTLRASLSRSRCSWSGASSSTFHRAACASPSVPHSVRSTVPSSSNSTRAQLNKTGSSHGSCNSRREV